MKLFSKGTIRKRLLLAEIVLIIASVFIFRGLWTLLDMVPFMYSVLALWLSLGVGVILSIISLRYLIKHSKG